jgi:hypothetical protein
MSPSRTSTVLATRAAVAPAPEREPRRADPNERGERPALRVVPSTPARRSVGPVVFLAGLALFGSLFGLAVFHAMLVQSQSSLDELDAEITTARAHREELRLDIAELEAPERILAEARDRGMVPAEDVVVLDGTADSETDGPDTDGPDTDGEAEAEGADG